MSNFIYYEKLEDYEEQVRKAKECDKKDKEIAKLEKEKIQLEKEKTHIEVAYEEDYKEQKQEIERLNNIIEKLEQENAVLKTQVLNKDKYSYGIRMGSDED